MKLYFITGIKNGKCIYKYQLASSPKEAKSIFLQKYSDYEIEELKYMAPSKKLIKEYENIRSK